MLEHAKIIWLIRKYLRHHSTGLTSYIGRCKDYLTDQNIPDEKSEAQDSQAALENAKIIWLIRTFLLRNQRHWTHMLCWNMQEWFNWSEHSFWEIRSIWLTCYVRTCKDYLTDQNIPFEESEALDSPAMLEHAKFIWLIRTFLLRNQRHWTHKLCWNQGLIHWSEHSFWEIRGTGLTCYSVGTYKEYLTDQNIPLRNHSTQLTSYVGTCTDYLTSEHYFERATELTSYVGTCKDYLTDQNIFWEIRDTELTSYVGTCKDCLMIRTFLLRN